MTRNHLLPAIPTITAALALGACGGSDPASPAPAAPAGFTSTECGTYSGRGCQPTSRRVDLKPPRFSHPTKIDNPYFPISNLRSALLLGRVDGKPFRTETTLLPGTSTVDWNGQKVRVLVSQYAAFLDGRLEEVALDRYAQADDGAVWYFGEDVFDYRKGRVALTEGTWLAGREGPAAMIMPGKPKVGDVFRAENVTGVVFEEVEIKSVGEKVVADELHADLTHDAKIFSRGYGEYRTSGGGDVEALALALPKDGLHGPVPAELTFLETSAAGILELIRLEDWEPADATLRRMDAARAKLRQPTRLVAERLDTALAALNRAVRAREPGPGSQAAIDVGQSVLDLELLRRTPAAIDKRRFELWTQQLRVDAAAKDAVAVAGDVAALRWVHDRFVHTLGPDARRDVEAAIAAVSAASDAGNPAAAADHAARLGARLRNP